MFYSLQASEMPRNCLVKESNDSSSQIPIFCTNMHSLGLPAMITLLRMARIDSHSWLRFWLTAEAHVLKLSSRLSVKITLKTLCFRNTYLQICVHVCARVCYFDFSQLNTTQVLINVRYVSPLPILICNSYSRQCFSHLLSFCISFISCISWLNQFLMTTKTAC